MTALSLPLAVTVALGAVVETSPETAPAPLETPRPAPTSGTEAGPGARDAAMGLWEANAAYDDGNYAEAARLYSEVIRSGHDGGSVYFNLGNAQLRAGRLGEAIAAYLLSRTRLPRDGDVLANLSFARNSIKDDISPTRPKAVLRALFFWHYAMSKAELGGLLLILNTVFWGVMALRLRRGRSEWLRWCAAGLLVFLVGTAASFGVRGLFPRRVAVVTDHEISVHSARTTDSVVRFVLHEGTEMAVVDRSPDWVRVRLSDGKQGWVPRSSVAVATL